MRIVLDVRGTGCSGYEVAAALREAYDIHVELATHATLVLILGLGQPPHDLDRFAHDFAAVVRQIRVRARRRPSCARRARSPTRSSCRRATRSSARRRSSPVDEAVGRVSAESIAGYPPGIPALLPGERITAELVAYLRELRDSGRAPARRVGPGLPDHLRPRRPPSVLDAATEALIERALAEDVGPGDATAEATVPADAAGVAVITQKAAGVISGLEAAGAVFLRLDPDAVVEPLGPEGVWREAPAPVLRVDGRARALLTAERTALEPARPPVRGRHGHRAGRARRGRGGRHRAGARHAQDDARACARWRSAPWPTAAASTTAPGSTTRSSSRRTTPRWPAGWGRRCGARGRRGPDLPLAVEVRDRGGDRRGARRGRAAAPAGQHEPGGGGGGGGAGGRPGGARGLRRRDAGDSCCLLDHKGARLRLDGRPDALRAAPSTCPSSWTPAMTLLQIDDIPAIQAEVRALAARARRRDPRPQLPAPEVQDVADFVGDSLGLSQRAAATSEDVIAFCGVHFMAETASILCPDKTVLLPDPDAGCSLADSIDAAQLRAWKAKHPGAVVVMYVNTTAEVKAETDYCVTSSNAVAVVEHIYREHGDDTEILFGPDMFLGAYVEKVTGRRMHVWDGECHVHAGIRPRDIAAMRDAHPGADFLIHPECGCSTSVMEYVAAGDVDPRGVHMLSTGGMLAYARTARSRGGRRSWRRRPACSTRCAWRPRTSTSWPPTRPRAAAS